MMTVASTLSIWYAIGMTALGLMLVTAAWTDVKSRRIPNSIVLWGAGAALVWALSPAGIGLALSLLGGMVAFITFLVLHGWGWVGAGDVKLAGATGLYFSPSHALMLCLTILIAGGVVALMWRFKFHVTRPVAVPYGVAIALGTAWHVGRQAVL
jgi:Flp pilus assembly protein protease CpaA